MAKVDKMGYIFPGRIKSIMRGEQPVVTFSMHNENENKEQKDKEREEKVERFQSAVPLFCPQCNKVMKKRLDSKYFLNRGKCLNCSVADDQKKILDGTFYKEQEEKRIANFIAMLKDAKAELEDYLSNFKPTAEFVTMTESEGVELEKWNVKDYEMVKAYMEFELLSITRQIEILENPDKESELKAKYEEELSNISKELDERFNKSKPESEPESI